jgi:hypothetical protein
MNACTFNQISLVLLISCFDGPNLNKLIFILENKQIIDASSSFSK